MKFLSELVELISWVDYIKRDLILNKLRKEIKISSENKIYVDYKPPNARTEWFITSDIEDSKNFKLMKEKEIYCIGLIYKKR